MENIVKVLRSIPGLEGAGISMLNPNEVYFGNSDVSELNSAQLGRILTLAADFGYEVLVQAGNDCEINLEFQKITG